MELKERIINDKSAQHMVAIYLSHSNEQGKLSDEGLGKLMKELGDVTEEQRGDVLIKFQHLLSEHGIAINERS